MHVSHLPTIRCITLLFPCILTFSEILSVGEQACKNELAYPKISFSAQRCFFLKLSQVVLIQEQSKQSFGQIKRAG